MLQQTPPCNLSFDLCTGILLLLLPLLPRHSTTSYSTQTFVSPSHVRTISRFRRSADLCHARFPTSIFPDRYVSSGRSLARCRASELIRSTGSVDAITASACIQRGRHGRHRRRLKHSQLTDVTRWPASHLSPVNHRSGRITRYNEHVLRLE